MGFEDNIRRVVPYVAGEQPSGKVIKLNTNEFPYPPSPKVREALMEIASGDNPGGLFALRKYPDMDATELVNAISGVYGVPFDKIFVGVGSDDVLSLSFMTFFNSEKPVFFPDITYSFYDVWASLHRIPFKTMALDESFRIVPEDYYAENGGIVIPNPNAPTGVFEDVSVMEDIISRNSDSVVIIDEAYVDFGGKSVLPLTDKYENLLVVQTFSKSRALAGLRVGVAFGSEKLIKYLKDVKFSFNSYTMNYPSIKAGAASVLDTEYFDTTVSEVIKTRDQTKEELKKLDFEFPDSKANFIFAKHKDKGAEDIFKALKERNIYVRYFKKPRIDNYLRISVGTNEDMQELINALKEILK